MKHVQISRAPSNFSYVPMRLYAGLPRTVTTIVLLFIVFFFYSVITNHPNVLGMAEMITYLPLSSPFIRLAGRFVDEAFGVAAGYNFFVSQVAQIPFEIVACNIIITYWSNAIPVGAIVAIVLVLYMYIYQAATL